MKKWYLNGYVLVMVFVSAVAASMAVLLLLLLPQSSEIIRLMQWRMVRVKSFRVETDVRYSGTVERKDESGLVRKEREALTLESGGWVDRSDPALETLEQRFTVAAGDAGAATVSGEYRKIGAADYFRFSSLPETVGALRLGVFREKWLRADVRKLRSLIDAPFFGGVRQLEEKDRLFLLDQLRLTPFFRFERKLKSEKLGGVSVHHYLVRPEMIFFKDYFIQAESLRLGRELSNKERIAADAFFANVSAEDGELWIGKGDYYLYRMRLRFRYDDGARSGILSFTADLGSFNKPSGAAAPSGEIQDVTGFIESLLPGIIGHLPLAKEGAARRVGEEEGGPTGLPVEALSAPGEEDADKDGLSAVLEHFYGSDPNDPDTDGDGVKDGEEVGQGRNPTGPGMLFEFGIGGR